MNKEDKLKNFLNQREEVSPELDDAKASSSTKKRQDAKTPKRKGSKKDDLVNKYQDETSLKIEKDKLTLYVLPGVTKKMNYVMHLWYLRKGKRITQSEIAENALNEYLDRIYAEFTKLTVENPFD